MTSESHCVLEMVPEVSEEPVQLAALTTGTLKHCVEHLTTSGDIFHNAGYPMYWFDNHTFTVDLPDGRVLFRVVTGTEAEGGVVPGLYRDRYSATLGNSDRDEKG
ncbi:hypothetical protein [Nocardia brasiliensis]|uniref:hypothetical protein n=1 Tax=Nocardia brasiliensis TaxID=37326 RepID=UPI002453EF73|nr:hypothetical protein [Nocardia brasiliensis]